MAIDSKLTRVVVSDVHGNYEAFRELLEDVGAVNSKGEKQRGFHVVQIGDLLNMTASSRAGDLVTLRLARAVCDEILCGNHELWFAWRLRAGIFRNMDASPEPELVRGINQLARQGFFNAATSVDEWLVSHAGVHRTYQQALPTNVNETAIEVQARFEEHILKRSYEDPLFDSIGRIRSKAEATYAGGIFWCDLVELALSGTRLQQIVGHTPVSVGEPVQISQTLWAIDPGYPKVAALVRSGTEGPWGVHCVSRPPDEIGGPVLPDTRDGNQRR